MQTPFVRSQTPWVPQETLTPEMVTFGQSCLRDGRKFIVAAVVDRMLVRLYLFRTMTVKLVPQPTHPVQFSVVSGEKCDPNAGRQ